MKKSFYYLGMTAIILANLMLIYFAYLSFYPIEIVRLNAPIKVSPHIVKAGEDVTLTMDFTKKKAYKPSVKYYLLCDDHVVTLDQDGINRSVGPHIVVIKRIIPKETAPDQSCKIQIDITYKVTPIRNITYSWNTENFSVR